MYDFGRTNKSQDYSEIIFKIFFKNSKCCFLSSRQKCDVTLRSTWRDSQHLSVMKKKPTASKASFTYICRSVSVILVILLFSKHVYVNILYSCYVTSTCKPAFSSLILQSGCGMRVKLYKRVSIQLKVYRKHPSFDIEISDKLEICGHSSFFLIWQQISRCTLIIWQVIMEEM